jgi:hypothetical protein
MTIHRLPHRIVHRPSHTAAAKCGRAPTPNELDDLVFALSGGGDCTVHDMIRHSDAIREAYVTIHVGTFAGGVTKLAVVLFDHSPAAPIIIGWVGRIAERIGR